MPHAILAFLGIGDTEILVIMAVILIFFGGGAKMPELARGLGKALKEFRKATSEVEREFKRVMEEAQNETVQPFKEAMKVPEGVMPSAVMESVMADPAPKPVSAEPPVAAAPPPPARVEAFHPPRSEAPVDQEFHSDI